MFPFIYSYTMFFYMENPTHLSLKVFVSYGVSAQSKHRQSQKESIRIGLKSVQHQGRRTLRMTLKTPQSDHLFPCLIISSARDHQCDLYTIVSEVYPRHWDHSRTPGLLISDVLSQGLPRILQLQTTQNSKYFIHVSYKYLWFFVRIKTAGTDYCLGFQFPDSVTIIDYSYSQVL